MLWTSSSIYSRTSLFRTRLIQSPRYFEGRSNALGFTLPLYASLVILKPRYFELFFHFPWDFEIAGFDCNTTWLQIQRAKLVKKRLLYHPTASLALHKAIICYKISQHKSITNNIHCTHSQQKKSLIIKQVKFLHKIL